MKRILSILLMSVVLGGGVASAQTDPFPAVNENAFPGNMIVVAQLIASGLSPTSNVVLAAYAGDEIRGKNVADDSGDFVFSMFVYGNTTGETLHFAVAIDGVIQQLEEETFTYKFNGQLGNYSQPHPVHVNGFSLADNDDNSDVLQAWEGKQCDVTLAGRTLYKDGSWNTLCLPFSLDATALAASPLAGAALRTMDVEPRSYTHITGLDGETLYLNFMEMTTVTAGIPFIVRWERPEDYDVSPADYDVTNPTFKGVTIDATMPASPTSNDQSVSFCGFYSPYVVVNEDRTKLFLGAADKLYYPNTAVTTGSCRAFFQLGAGITVGNAEQAASVRRTILNFSDGTTGIDLKDFNDLKDLNDAWYSLSGRRLDGVPTAKGIHITKGRKVLTK